MRFGLLFAFALILGFAQDTRSWKRPFPSHKIAGNLFYVGTEDLACFLVTTPEGHILINTGLSGSTPLIRSAVEKQGFRLEDVKILLTMQAHFDHVGAMAEIQRVTGAKLFATAGDAPILEDGGKSDPYFGAGSRFAPVKVDRVLKDGDPIRIGGTELTLVSTPGHSKGSASYLLTVDDGGRKRLVAIVNMATVVMPLKGNARYPGIANDFERTFARQKGLSPDIWVTAHASQYNMAEKLEKGSFVDRQGYKNAVAEHEKAFREKLASTR